MKSISVSAIVILLLVSIAAFAQEPQALFCNAALWPDSYIEFSGLPAPPGFAAAKPAAIPSSTEK
jgi:hypothetical protein